MSITNNVLRNDCSFMHIDQNMLKIMIICGYFVIAIVLTETIRNYYEKLLIYGLRVGT